MRNASRDTLVPSAVVACICCSGGALLCAVKTACRIAEGTYTTGGMERCKRCPSKLI